MNKKILEIIGILIVTFIIALNVSLISGSNQKSQISLLGIGLMARADGEGETKWVIEVECECSNGKTGYTLDCTTEETEMENCTTDPLTSCYLSAGGSPYVCD
jgi:hypothetical protein